MPKPQQPELRRSGETQADEDHTKTTLGVGTPGGDRRDAPLGTPEANRPGHHPAREQDKPDADAFARRFGIRRDDASSQGDDDASSQGDHDGRDHRSRGRAGTARAPGGGGQAEPSKAELVEQAKQAGVTGYSRMNKAELAEALGRA